MTKVEIYTDGSCLGNKTGSPGGWAAILVHKSKELVLRGFDAATTNNRMELTAVIEAIKKLTRPCEVTVYTDSTYVMTSYTSSKPKKNLQLIADLKSAVSSGGHEIRFQHIYGHTGHVYNERCDRIAKEQAMKARFEKWLSMTLMER